MSCKLVNVLVNNQLNLDTGVSVSLRYELFPNQSPSFGVKVRVMDGEVDTTCMRSR